MNYELLIIIYDVQLSLPASRHVRISFTIRPVLQTVLRIVFVILLIFYDLQEKTENDARWLVSI